MGTVFVLTPSGKYYQPFACGNLASCPLCDGHGELQNIFVDEQSFTFWRDVSYAMRGIAMERYGAWCNGQWPDEFIEALHAIDAKTEFYAPTIDCPQCGGLGSDEAYLDTIWWEKADALYESHSFHVESGEGDPCDILAVQYRDKAESDEEGEDE